MISPPVFSGVRITRFLVLCVCFVYRCLSFCTFSFSHCVVCTFSIYGFWLPPFDIFKFFFFYWWCKILSVLIFAELFIGSRKSQFFFLWSINGKIVVRLVFLDLRWLDMYFWFYFLQWQSIKKTEKQNVISFTFTIIFFLDCVEIII